MGKLKTILGVLALLFVLSSVLAYVLDADFSDTIALIPLRGAIVSTSSSSLLTADTITSDNLIKLLHEAEENPAVRGIVLEINSPGGTVVASKEVVDTVKSLQKPVVAWIREIGTSGAYWVASASDAIVADELSLTGSIGVISSYLEFSDLFDKYGISYEGLKTGKYKDIGSPFKQLTEEERTLLQHKIQYVHDYFVADVSRNRDLPEENVRQLATGIYYLGAEAYDLGLVDYLGGKELALNITKQLANITDAEIKTFEPKRSFFDLLSKLSSNAFFFMGRGFGSELKSVDLKTRNTPSLFA
ncbi:MAG: signal peptide peptidase SppA [Nanoarchaeota archaeon]